MFKYTYLAEVSLGEVIKQLKKLPAEERVTIAAHLFPDGEVLEDNDGQQVIYTGVYSETKESPKPEVRWSLLSKEFKYLAMDEDRRVYLYMCKPVLSPPHGRWFGSREGLTLLGPASGIGAVVTIPPGLDWQDSLVKRPE